MSTDTKPLIDARDIPLPRDPRHQRLVDLILDGVPKGDAYASLYPRSAKKSRNPACGAVLRRPDVKAYMASIRRAAAIDTALSVAEKRQFLARVVRCKPNVEPDDSDLWQEIRIEETETASRITRKLPGKCECIKLDNELDGSDPATNALDKLATALARLGKS